MKRTLFFKSIIIITILCRSNYANAQVTEAQLQDLVGTWTLDMTPENDTDNDFAYMQITEVGPNSLQGEFYRESVKIREGRINTKLGIIYCALISGDNSGDYYTTFYLKDNKLYGTTHSEARDFLAVWTGTKNI
jgi:hypothetical protein